MNSLVAIAFFALVAYTNAGVLVGPSTQILQGPSSKTTIVGPEGSVITAVAPGGQIVHEEHPGVVAHASPIVSYAAPVLAHAAPVVAHASPVIAHSAPTTLVAHSSAYEQADVVVAGPSGTVATGKSAHLAHGAPVVAYAAPYVAHAAPYVAHDSHVVAHAGPVVALVAHGDVDDNGYEGQYAHDHSEHLYDDGSYRHYHY